MTSGSLITPHTSALQLEVGHWATDCTNVSSLQTSLRARVCRLSHCIMQSTAPPVPSHPSHFLRPTLFTVSTRAPAATANVTYPVGTVLMYPREVVPRDKTSGHGACDSPWFIVFKPYAATLLRGAVPVGRVMSFVKGQTASTSDNSAQPFDANVLQCFETYAIPQTGQQCKSNHSCMFFSSFMPV